LNPISVPETLTRTQTPLNPSQPADHEPWNIQEESKLTSDDFAPKLKDRFSNRAASPGSSPPLELAQIPSLNATDNFPEEFPQTSSSNQADLPARIAANLSDPPPAAGSEFITNRPNYPDARDPSAPGVNQPQSSERVRAKLPFRLTEESRSELARLRTSADSKMALQTTKFVDHVVQSGETLQSISTRYFGKPDYYLDIYLANRNKLRNPAVVPVGITVRVPMYQ
jgi:nucleoid-associated protein YgaU